ncbi:hypothetical protein J5X07_11515 [Actinomyces bowdenii]|uniref:hypothetical protein n=1 Tax=Actinomyces bowdenii TaxID=131109 RepID=UPI001ABD1974|nr:hypothetical protein [Actinomyces bowdenii]
MSPSKPRRGRATLRATAHALIVMMVVGMVLDIAGSALAGPAAPASAGGPAGPGAPAARSPGEVRPSQGPPASPTGPAERPTPTIVLATYNLTWSDLAVLSREPDSAEDAAMVLDFARANEPVNLVPRSLRTRTSLQDGWTTLGAGTRMGWFGQGAERRLEPAGSTAPGALARALEARGLSVSAVRQDAYLALEPHPGQHRGSTAAPDAGPSAQEAVRAADSDLTLIDTTLQEGRIGDAGQLASLAQALRAALARADSRILLVSLADDEDPGPQIAVLPAGTTGARGRQGGLIVGDSTHRPGLIQLTDLAPTLIESLTGQAASGLDGHALRLPPGPTAPPGPSRSGSAPGGTGAGLPSDPRLDRLLDDALHARASHASVIPSSTLLMAAALGLLVAAALALGRPGAGEAGRRRALGGVRAGALVVAALPAGALLSNLLPWWRAGSRDGVLSALALLSGMGALLLMAMAVLGLLAVAVLGLGSLPGLRGAGGSSAARAMSGHGRAGAAGTRSGLSGPLGLALAAATCLGWLIDGASGAHLSFNGVLGMNAVVAGRFYGMSNTAFALAGGALMVLIAVVADEAGRRRRILAPVVVAALGGAALVLDGAPQLGADVGGALTLVPALVALAAALMGWRLGWRRWLLVGAVTCGTVAGFAALDLARPDGQRTHLGRFALGVLDGSALSTIARKASALVRPFLAYPPALLLLVLAAVALAAAVLWGHAQRRQWRAGTSRYGWLAQQALLPPPWWPAALRALGVLTVVAVALNDSGVTMAGFVLVAAAPTALAIALAPAPPHVLGPAGADSPPPGSGRDR